VLPIHLLSLTHCHHRITTVLPSPSCCGGVAFVIMSWQCRLRLCIVAVSPLPSHRASGGVAFTVVSLQGHLCHRIITGSSLLSCHRSVDFTVVVLWCRLRHCVVMVPPSLSHHLVIAGSPSPSHRRGVIFAIVLLQCHLHHRAVTVSPLPLHRCGVAFAIALLQCHLRGVNCSICQHVSTIRNRLSGKFQSWPIAMACHACHMLLFNVSFCVMSDSPVPSGPQDTCSILQKVSAPRLFGVLTCPVPLHTTNPPALPSVRCPRAHQPWLQRHKRR